MLPLTISVLCSAGASDGAYALLDVRAPAGTALPPHAPSREDGTLLVLEGELELVLGGERTVARRGDALSLPRMVPRRMRVVDDLHALLVCMPAGLERLADLATPPPLCADDVAALLSAAGVALLPAAAC